jgi:predicted transcriptional regulator
MATMTKRVIPPMETPRDEPAFRAAVAQGIAEADAGQGMPFEKVAEWLATWGTDDETPAPQ